jgi:hypothetical protein
VKKPTKGNQPQEKRKLYFIFISQEQSANKPLPQPTSFFKLGRVKMLAWSEETWPLI